ncbi:hypothetical protein NEIELOOT_01656 [Neisseria elongata subsp. glycolytica ATCC 29315]|uniref:Uncharacterized protein n=1 Tax=Neisseria elongata subsp. glycolytica ATCC 29315 TaxID=546263 RepID=D4DRG3_NEIEG|nr:hypothetical protein NEIELOOT_01656 [Neisseria elongata subsp. glycolytica ATCC 29315]
MPSLGERNFGKTKRWILLQIGLPIRWMYRQPDGHCLFQWWYSDGLYQVEAV